MNQRAHLVVWINAATLQSSPYAPHILDAAKKILMRNCKHHRKAGDCRFCAQFSAKDNACKIGVPSAWE